MANEFSSEGVKQIYDIVNLIAKQAMGDQAVTVVDTGSFVALGKTIESNQLYKEAFYSAIPDVVARTIVSSRKLTRKMSKLVRKSFEFGMYIRKINVFMPEAVETQAWQIGQEDFTPVPPQVIKSDVRVDVFAGYTTWSVGVTIPDVTARTAFSSEQEMGALWSAIFVAMENSMTMAIMNVANLTRANFMAHKLLSSKKIAKVNLLAEYNTLTNRSLTLQLALMDEEFLAWATAQLQIWAKRMTVMSTVFNEKNYQRHTPEEMMSLDILQDFESYVKVFLKRISFNENLVNLPNYETVPYWQGSGEDFSWESISSINVTPKSNEGGEAQTVSQSGIIAVMYDVEALGLTIMEEIGAVERNNRAKYTDYWNDANMGYFNDLSENGIVFYMAEE